MVDILGCLALTVALGGAHLKVNRKFHAGGVPTDLRRSTSSQLSIQYKLDNTSLAVFRPVQAIKHTREAIGADPW